MAFPKQVMDWCLRCHQLSLREATGRSGRPHRVAPRRKPYKALAWPLVLRAWSSGQIPASYVLGVRYYRLGYLKGWGTYLPALRVVDALISHDY